MAAVSKPWPGLSCRARYDFRCHGNNAAVQLPASSSPISKFSTTKSRKKLKVIMCSTFSFFVVVVVVVVVVFLKTRKFRVGRIASAGGSKSDTGGRKMAGRAGGKGGGDARTHRFRPQPISFQRFDCCSIVAHNIPYNALVKKK